jgi:uncharacterized protein YcfL
MKASMCVLSALSVVLVVGCSSSEEEHVWQDQTNTIKKAQQVQQTVQDTFDRQRKVLEEQSH